MLKISHTLKNQQTWAVSLLNTSMYTNSTTSLLSYRRHLSSILYLQITSPWLFWLASNLKMLGHINSSIALGMLAAKNPFNSFNI